LKTIICKHCNKSHIPSRGSLGFYCSVKCQQDFQYKTRIDAWKAGILTKGWRGKTRALACWLRRYLLEKYDCTCVKCGWNKRHPVDNLPLVEVNHIDGNAENCKEDNLEVLCPNCHSMTPNFRRRNAESTRER